MRQYEIKESKIPDNLAINLRERFQIEIWKSACVGIYRVIFTTIAEILKDQHNENPNAHKIAVSFNDRNNNFIIGGILTYRAPDADEEEDSGNYYLELTFDEKDFDGIEHVFSNNNNITSFMFDKSITYHMYHICSAQIKEISYVYDIITTAINTLKEFLDVNADPNEEVEVFMRSVFTASVVVEDGIKIMTIVPGEIIKQIVKNDDVL